MVAWGIQGLYEALSCRYDIVTDGMYLWYNTTKRNRYKSVENIFQIFCMTTQIIENDYVQMMIGYIGLGGVTSKKFVNHWNQGYSLQ